MISRLALVGWSACAAAITSAWAATASADPVVVAAQVLYESPSLVVPVLIVDAPSDASDLRVSQAGWTTTLAAETVRSPRVSLAADPQVTPLFAHASNRVYRNGAEDTSLEFHDTAAQARWGLIVRPTGWARVDLRWVALEEWVSGAPGDTAAMWRRPYGGVEASVTFARVRADDVFRARWDGIKATAFAQGFVGETRWWRGEAVVGAGRRAGPVFAFVSGHGVYVSSPNVVARWLEGGSWDALGAQALWGHPYGEFRVDRAASGLARLDVEIVRDVEIGVRGGAMVARDGLSHGEAVQASAGIGGVLWTVGVGAPDADPGRALVYASAAGATFF